MPLPRTPKIVAITLNGKSMIDMVWVLPFRISVAWVLSERLGFVFRGAVYFLLQPGMHTPSYVL